MASVIPAHASFAALSAEVVICGSGVLDMASVYGQNATPAQGGEVAGVIYLDSLPGERLFTSA